jgi:hypothetical protein
VTSPIDSETLLATDFLNLKIKSIESFIGAHMGRVYVCVFIGVIAHMYMNIYIYTVFLKKRNHSRLAYCKDHDV